jgi:hypothetical protein
MDGHADPTGDHIAIHHTIATHGRPMLERHGAAAPARDEEGRAMDIIKVLAVYSRWFMHVKTFGHGEGTWAQILADHHALQVCNRWLYEAPHLRHCPEYTELMDCLPAAELAIQSLVADLDRGALTRVAVSLTSGSPVYRTIGRYKTALHALHEAVEEPMGLRSNLVTRLVGHSAWARTVREAVKAS